MLKGPLVALAVLLVASQASSETIKWATTGEFPEVIAWELCDKGGVCTTVYPTAAAGGTLPDGRQANFYWADVLVLAGIPSWIQAITNGATVIPINKNSRVWCSHWDFDGSGRVGAIDLATWLASDDPFGAPEFSNGLVYFWRSCK